MSGLGADDGPMTDFSWALFGGRRRMEVRAVPACSQGQGACRSGLPGPWPIFGPGRVKVVLRPVAGCALEMML